MTNISTYTRHNLSKQGFRNLDDTDFVNFKWSLRFTPGVSILLIAIGLRLQSPFLLGSVALFAFIGTVFPKAMPIDVLYNFGVRYLLRVPPLPPSPKPRQFSYLLSGLFLTGSAVSFYVGKTWLGFVFGGSVLVAGTVLVTTLWCLGSWYYNFIFRNKHVDTLKSDRFT